MASFGDVIGTYCTMVSSAPWYHPPSPMAAAGEPGASHSFSSLLSSSRPAYVMQPHTAIQRHTTSHSGMRRQLIHHHTAACRSKGALCTQSTPCTPCTLCTLCTLCATCTPCTPCTPCTLCSCTLCTLCPHIKCTLCTLCILCIPCTTCTLCAHAPHAPHAPYAPYAQDTRAWGEQQQAFSHALVILSFSTSGIIAGGILAGGILAGVGLAGVGLTVGVYQV
jgi:hypothetical protein